MSQVRFFPRLFTHGGDFGETSAGGQSVNGGTHEGGHSGVDPAQNLTGFKGVPKKF